MLAALARVCSLCLALCLTRTAAAAQRAPLPPGTRPPPSPAAASEFALGQAAFARRDLAEASRRFERAAALEPSNSLYETWKGRVYGERAARAGLFAKAALARRTKAALDRAVELDAANLEAREYRMEYYLVAPRIMGGSADRARDEAAAIGQRNPFLGMLAQAHVEERLKHWPEAERLYKAADLVQHDPPVALYRLGIVYQATGAYDKAFDLYEGLVRSYPSFARSWYQLGRTGAVSGQRLDRSEEALRHYLASTPAPDDPPLSGARFRLGQIYERKGDLPRARGEYREALRLDSGNRDAAAALERTG